MTKRILSGLICFAALLGLNSMAIAKQNSDTGIKIAANNAGKIQAQLFGKKDKKGKGKDFASETSAGVAGASEGNVNVNSSDTEEFKKIQETKDKELYSDSPDLN